MNATIYDSTASIQQLIEGGFELPIHFAAVGVDGAVVAGTFRRSGHDQEMDCVITVETSRSSLEAPVNILYVDRRGEAALVAVRQEAPPRAFD